MDPTLSRESHSLDNASNTFSTMQLALPGFSIHTLWFLHWHWLLIRLSPLESLCPLVLAPPRTCFVTTNGQGHVGLFYETIQLKDRRYIDGLVSTSALSRHCLWFTPYLLGLSSTIILHISYNEFAGEFRSVQMCVQCPVKFTKQHVTPICRKRI